MKYTINIHETFVKQVEVDAPDYNEAFKKVRKMYFDGKIILNAEDFYEVEFF